MMPAGVQTGFQKCPCLQAYQLGMQNFSRNSFGEVSLHTAADIVSCRFHITADIRYLSAHRFGLRLQTINGQSCNAVGLRLQDLDCVLNITDTVVFLFTRVVCTALMAKQLRADQPSITSQMIGCSLLCLSRDGEIRGLHGIIFLPCPGPSSLFHFNMQFWKKVRKRLKLKFIRRVIGT